MDSVRRSKRFFSALLAPFAALLVGAHMAGDAVVTLIHASRGEAGDTEEDARCILSVAIGPGTGCTVRASVATDGTQTDSSSTEPALSGDGRFVAFRSDASHLIPDDTNFSPDVFLRNLPARTTERASLAFNGAQANIGGLSHTPSVSEDGRYVAFGSFANNLVAGNPNEFIEDVFVRDRQAGTTELISVAPGGGPGNGTSRDPSISADGRYVAFGTFASDLVAGDGNVQAEDVLVRDRTMGTTERASVSSDEAAGGSDSRLPSISADGRFVAFMSAAGNLIPDDVNGITEDVFVRDRELGVTEVAAVDKDGHQSTVTSYNPSISGDGRFVAFASFDPNLVDGDANQAEDIFVRDRELGVTERVNVASDGAEAIGQSLYPAISADGRYVAFLSFAANLVPNDTLVSLDVFVRDRELGVTERVNVSTDGVPGASIAVAPSISADGAFVAFVSDSRFLVPGDTNNVVDIFVRNRAP